MTAPARPVRGSLWGQVTARFGPGALAVAPRYATLVRLGAHRADPRTFAASAREDCARLATALNAVLALHAPDARHRCEACSVGPFLVDWPCRTRRAADHGLAHGWPAPPADAPAGAPAPEPDSYESFALAVLAVHDVLPDAGGQPARCRACRVPPDRCAVWALAGGFLDMSWPSPGKPDRDA